MVLVSAPAIAKDQTFKNQAFKNQTFKNQCAGNPDCAVPKPAGELAGELVGEPVMSPQPETPISLEITPANVQTMTEAITFEPSVSTVLRVLNDLGSSVGSFN
ncbi:MAG: hypothetical protein WA949_22330 [Phormidesmis sp.]